MSEKELVSASGKGHSAIAAYWVQSLVGIAILVPVFIILANKLGYTEEVNLFGATIVNSTRTGVYYFFVGAAVLGTVFLLYSGYSCQHYISLTAIQVYEDIIKGSSVDPVGFKYSLKPPVSDFHLTYDQISSVDVVDGKTLVIHVGNVQHKIWAMNAGAVRDAIVAQKKAVGQAA
jgi:hypothetical protein